MLEGQIHLSIAVSGVGCRLLSTDSFAIKSYSGYTQVLSEF